MRDVHRPKYGGPYSIDCRERGTHARGVYPTQDTSSMGTAKVKQEEQTDTRIMRESSTKSGRKERGPKQGLTRAKDLTMELPESQMQNNVQII